MSLIGCIILSVGIICGILAIYPYIYYLRRINKLQFSFIPQKNIEYPKISIVINAYREGELVADRIKEKIQEENLKDERHMFITAAFGFAEKTLASDTIDTILLRALEMLDKKETSIKTNRRKTKKERIN